MKQIKDIDIIDRFINKYEFRNYTLSLLLKDGYELIRVDDPRTSDNFPINDNDILLRKEDYLYTIQTYLNTKITEDQVNESINDINYEKASYCLMLCNKDVDKEIKKMAKENCTTIIDRKELIKLIRKYE